MLPKKFKGVGISLSSLVNSYLRQIAATRRIVYAPETMTPKLEGLIAEVEAQLHSGKVGKKFANADDFLANPQK